MKCCCDKISKLLEEISINIGNVNNGGGTGGGTNIDYTVILNNILSSLNNVDASVQALPEYTSLIDSVETTLTAIVNQLATMTSNDINSYSNTSLELTVIRQSLNNVVSELVTANSALTTMTTTLNQEATQLSVLSILTDLKTAINQIATTITSIETTSALLNKETTQIEVKDTLLSIDSTLMYQLATIVSTLLGLTKEGTQQQVFNAVSPIVGLLNTTNNTLYDQLSQLFAIESNTGTIKNNAPLANVNTQTITSTLHNSIGVAAVPNGIANARSVTFKTSADFVGTINGIFREADTAYTFNASEFRILQQISFSIAAGSVITDVISG
jgi:hypothetical protein